MRVGLRMGLVHDPSRPAWHQPGPRPIAWAAWYPTLDTAIERPMRVGGTGEPWFDLGPVAMNAPLAGRPTPYPVALLSHGTGGCGLDLGWLGRRLAQRGFVVLAPNHHGNTSAEALRPEGFLCWWERAGDLSALLDGIASDRGFGDRLALDRVLVCGFSLGGHTSLTLLGATTDLERYRVWAAEGPFSRGPSNFPDLAAHLPALLKESPTFRASWERSGADYCDPRIAAALLMAPAPPVRAFSEAKLAGIAAPVHIVSGGADPEAPMEVGAEWLAQHLPQCRLDILASKGGHLMFLPEATDAGKRMAPDLCCDAPGVERAEVHDATCAAAAALLAGSSVFYR